MFIEKYFLLESKLVLIEHVYIKIIYSKKISYDIHNKFINTDICQYLKVRFCYVKKRFCT